MSWTKKNQKPQKSAKGPKIVIDLDRPEPKKRAKDEEVKIQETPIPKPKKKAKNAPPSEKEENAKDVMRAVKKAASVKRIPIPAKTDVFYMGEEASPRKLAVKRLAAGGAKVPSVFKRPRRMKNIAVA